MTGGANLPIVSGKVDVDGTAAIRRRANLVVVDPNGTLTPTGSTSPLSPYGREVRIKRGIRFADGSTELITLGTFRIASATPTNSGTSRKIDVSAFDRARSVARARFETPYTVDAGLNYALAIEVLLKNRLPGITVSNLTATTRTTGLTVFAQGADPWESARSMATDIGAVLYFNPDGVAVLTNQPNPANLSVSWDYSRGVKATVIGVDNSFSDDPGFNGVVVDGEPPDAEPVHVAVYDLDQTSPTYALGAYGKVPYFFRSQFITTVQQATAAATALLLTNRGGTELVKFTGIPHPALEVGDVVLVADPGAGVFPANYVLDSFTIPLDLSIMTASTRKRRTI